MNAAELKSRLQSQALAVCEMLFPNGKKTGAEWKIGSIAGEAGGSLGVHLTGDRAGVWQDFATGDKGGILDLWLKARGVDFPTACKQAREWLGIKPDSPDAFYRPPAARKSYVRPDASKAQPIVSGGPVFDYLTVTRGLEAATLHRYKVGQVTHPAHGPCIVFPCYSPDGSGVDLIKYLGVKRGEDGKKVISASKDSKPRLFGWQAIDRKRGDVYLTEGEIDCLTLASWGFNALSLPMGTNGLDWIEHDFEALEDFERIYLCTDMDAPGHKCANEIAQRLGRERCYRVTLPAPLKDANEALTVGKFCEFDFHEQIDAAKTLDPGELRNIAEFSDAAWESLYPTSQATQGTTPPVNLGDWRCRFGELSIWTGISSHGKTIMLNNFAVNDARQGEKICLVSLEMPASELAATLIRIVLGTYPQTQHREKSDAALAWLGDKFWLVDKVGVLHWSKVLPLLAYAAKRYGCTRFVIDSLVRLGVRDDDLDGQAEAVSAILAFAAEYGHVHLVVHPKKGEDETTAPGKFNVRGSGSMTDLCHNGFTVWRNKDKEKKMQEMRDGIGNQHDRAKIEGAMDAQISMWKNRKTGQEPWQRLWFHKGSGQFLDTPTAQPVTYLPIQPKTT